MESLAPVLLFVYNRPEHVLKTLEALKKNDLAIRSKLYIFSDGPKDQSQVNKVNHVRSIIANVEGFDEVNVILSNQNKGLANSIIDGVTKIINEYGKVIVLEDDLLTSKYFLAYMNEALNYYKSDKNIWSISGYTPNLKFPIDYHQDVYVTPRGCSWGWGTWTEKWNSIDWEIKDYESFRRNKKQRKKFNIPGNDMSFMLDDQIKGHINSWAIRWCYNQFKQGSLTIYPRTSFIENNGFNGDSTHGSINGSRYIPNISQSCKLNIENVQLNNELIKSFAEFYNLRAVNYIGRILKMVGLYSKVKKIYKKFQ